MTYEQKAINHLHLASDDYGGLLESQILTREKVIIGLFYRLAVALIWALLAISVNSTKEVS